MNILIAEGNTLATTNSLIQSGCRNYIDIFADVLKHFYPNINISTINSTDVTVEIPSVQQLQQFSGVIWTGSLLSAYEKSPEVQHQLELSEQIFRSRIPYYGSCYGIQLATTAAGGSVAPSSNGVEIGLCEKLEITADGKHHILLQHRKTGDRVLCLHGDEVVKLPPMAKVLATNQHSKIQGIEIEHLGGKFVGVQYHPEFKIDDVVGLYNFAYDYLLHKKYNNDKTQLNLATSQLQEQNFYDIFNQNFYQSHCIEIYNWLKFMVK